MTKSEVHNNKRSQENGKNQHDRLKFVRRATVMAGVPTTTNVGGSGHSKDRGKAPETDNTRQQWINICQQRHEIASRNLNCISTGAHEGQAVCFQYHLQQKLISDPHCKKRLEQHPQFKHLLEYALQGCPYANPSTPTKGCKGLAGEERAHEIHASEMPMCTFKPSNGGKCTSVWCVYKHTPDALPNGATSSHATGCDNIHAHAEAARQIADLQRRLDVANSEITAVQHKLAAAEKSDITSKTRAEVIAAEHDAYVRVTKAECSNLYQSIFGPCGMCCYLPAPTRNAAGDLEVPSNVERFIMTCVAYSKSAAPADWYIIQHGLDLNYFKESADAYGAYYPTQVDDIIQDTIRGGVSSVDTPSEVEEMEVTTQEPHDDGLAYASHSGAIAIHQPAIVPVSSSDNTDDMILALYTDVTLPYNVVCFSKTKALEQCNRLRVGQLDDVSLPYALLHVFAPPHELQHATVLNIFSAEFRSIPGQEIIPTMCDLGFNPTEHFTHKFILEFYCNIRVSTTWLRDVMNDDCRSIAHTRMQAMGDAALGHSSVLSEYVGEILLRQSSFTYNGKGADVSTNGAQKCYCESAHKAWSIANECRIDACFYFVSKMLECEQFNIGNCCNIIEQVYTFIRTRPEVINAFDKYMSPKTHMKPTRILRYTHAGDRMSFNALHPNWNHFAGMCARAETSDKYSWDVVGDRAFGGLYCPSLYAHHGRDAIGFTIFDMAVHKILGPKPGSPDSAMSRVWVLDRTNTFLHYTLCNMSWKTPANNAANKKNMKRESQHLRLLRLRRWKRNKRFQRFRKRLNTSNTIT